MIAQDDGDGEGILSVRGAAQHDDGDPYLHSDDQDDHDGGVLLAPVPAAGNLLGTDHAAPVRGDLCSCRQVATRRCPY